MGELIIQSGKHQGRRLRFADAEITIGRDDDCQIRLTSADVSKRHCRLRPDDDGLLVEDLGSSNGTFVNESRISSEMRLRPGDRLRIGPMVFEVPVIVTTRPEDKPSGGKKSKSLSEDDIASWLSDETDHGDMSAAADTTIIATTAPAPASPVPAAETSPLMVAAPPGSAARDDKKKFRNVAEEAADIIRRWWQVQREEQNQP